MGDSDSDEEEMLQYKIILLGDGTVGKTSIAMRFTNDEFGQQYKQVCKSEMPGWVCRGRVPLADSAARWNQRRF